MTSGTQHFKCPNCNNKEAIAREFKKLGIYLPQKDAEWELPSYSSFYNFQEMYLTVRRCAVAQCWSEGGRDLAEVEGRWEVVLCLTCGSNGTHLACRGDEEGSRGQEQEQPYVCRDCGGQGPELEDTPALDTTVDTSLDTSRGSALLDSSVELNNSGLGEALEQEAVEEQESCEQQQGKAPKKPDFFARKEEMIALLAGIQKKEERKKEEEEKERLMEVGETEDEDNLEEERHLEKELGKEESNLEKELETPKPKPGLISIRKDLTTLSFQSTFGHIFARNESLPDGFDEPMEEVETAEEELEDAMQEGENPINISDKKRKFGSIVLQTLNANPIKQVKPKLNPCFMTMLLRHVQPNYVSKATPETETIPSKTITTPYETITTPDETIKTPSESTADHNLDEDSIDEDLIDELLDSPKKQSPDEGTVEKDSYLKYIGSTVVHDNRDATISAASLELLKKCGLSDETAVEEEEIDEEVVKATNVEESNIEEIENEPVKNIVVQENVKENAVSPIIEPVIRSEMIEDNVKSPEKQTNVSTEKEIEIANNPVETIDLEPPVKKYRPGPKSRKRFLEITEPNNSPKKSKPDETNAVMEALTECFKIEDFRKLASTKFKSMTVTEAERVVVYKLFIIWFKQLDRIKCEECEKTFTDSWDVMGHTVTDCTFKFKNFILNIEKFLLSWPDSKKTEVIRGVTDILRTFLMGSWCLLCSTEQTNLRNHLSQIHFKKSLLAYCRVVSPIKFECVFPGCGEVFLSNYRLICHLSCTHSLLQHCLLALPPISPSGVIETSTTEEGLSQHQTVQPQVFNKVVVQETLRTKTINNPDVQKSEPTVPAPTPSATPALPSPAAASTGAPTGAPTAASTGAPTVAATGADPVSKRATKRPFQCPVCQGWFRSEVVLQQHMAKIHFWNKLLALPRSMAGPQGTTYHCSEAPCQYQNPNQTIVAGHLAVTHKVVFTIAGQLFPGFKLPVLPGPEEEIMILDNPRPPAQEQRIPLRPLLPATFPPANTPAPGPGRPLAPLQAPLLPVARVRPAPRSQPGPAQGATGQPQEVHKVPHKPQQTSLWHSSS